VVEVRQLAQCLLSQRLSQSRSQRYSIHGSSSKPSGLGWGLVGDAGYYKDPNFGEGIIDAFRDAETLANALDNGFSGRQPLENALAE